MSAPASEREIVQPGLTLETIGKDMQQEVLRFMTLHPTVVAGIEEHEYQRRTQAPEAAAFRQVSRRIRDQVTDVVGTNQRTGRPNAVVPNRMGIAVNSLRWLVEWVAQSRGIFPRTGIWFIKPVHRDDAINFNPPALLETAATESKVRAELPFNSRDIKHRNAMHAAWREVFPDEPQKRDLFLSKVLEFDKAMDNLHPMKGLSVAAANMWEALRVLSEQPNEVRINLETAIGFVMSAIEAWGGRIVWTAFVWWLWVHDDLQLGSAINQFVWMANYLEFGEGREDDITVNQLDKLRAVVDHSSRLRADFQAVLTAFVEEVETAYKDCMALRARPS